MTAHETSHPGGNRTQPADTGETMERYLFERLRD